VDSATLDKQLHHEPGFFTGWNGAATAGATGGERDAGSVCGIGKHRAGQGDPDGGVAGHAKPHLGGFQRIVRQDYAACVYEREGVFTPASVTKSSISHFDAERDEIFPAILFSGTNGLRSQLRQDLNLQQILRAAGLGLDPALKTPKQEADLKATAQYEKQDFITGASSANQNLIGSTFSASYC